MAGAAHPLAQPPPPLVEWSDDVLNAIFCRVPFLSHGAVRAVCRRTRALLSLPAFRKERLDSGYAESGVIVAGGYTHGFRHTAACWLLAGGRWWPRSPMSGPSECACSAVIDNELWVCGGGYDSGQLAKVEAYSAATNTWRSLPDMNERRDAAVCGVWGTRVPRRETLRPHTVHTSHDTPRRRLGSGSGLWRLSISITPTRNCNSIWSITLHNIG